MGRERDAVMQEAYCGALVRYKEELSKPFDEAASFLSSIETQLSNLCSSSTSDAAPCTTSACTAAATATTSASASGESPSIRFTFHVISFLHATPRHACDLSRPCNLDGTSKRERERERGKRVMTSQILSMQMGYRCVRFPYISLYLSYLYDIIHLLLPFYHSS